MSKLLVTGATGFLGGAVIAQLINEPGFEDTCYLVRADTKAEGRDRLVKVLKGYEIPDALIAKLKAEQVILGDFKKVAPIFNDPLIKEVTHVINCAAIASFAPNHPDIRKVNVDGTFKFVKGLHDIGAVKRFVHVGTAMCFGGQAPKVVDETYVPPPNVKHVVPYTETKIEIEEKIRKEFPYFPMIQARPSIVVGHTKLGIKPSASIFWVFRMAQLLEKFTIWLEERIDVVPVDWVAASLITLARKEKLAHPFYLLSAGPQSASNFREIDEALARGRGVEPIAERYERVELPVLKEMRSTYKEKLGECNPRIIWRAIELYGYFAALNIVFKNDRLLSEGIPTPPSFASYADVCQRTSEGTLVGDQMMIDFK